MKELIKVTKQTIGDDEVNAVDARGLHKFLDVKSEFRNWIKNRIDQYNFTQGIDFIAGKKLPGSDRKEYTISLDMAKELSMVEKNQKGKQARKYFIECERIAQGKISNKPSNVLEEELKIFALLKVPEHIAQIESVKQVEKKCGINLSYALLFAPAQNNIKDEEIMLEPTELGKHFNMSAVSMNKTLMSYGLQFNDGTGWKPTKMGEDIATIHSWTSGTKSGYNLKWNLNKIKGVLKDCLN